MWKTVELRLDKILANLKRHTKFLDRHASIITIQESIERRANEKRDFEEQLEWKRNEQKLSVTKWLNPSGPNNTGMRSVYDRYKNILEEYGETCDWFLNDPVVKEWTEGKSKKGLWLSGIPGAGKGSLSTNPMATKICSKSISGKTVLASALIDKLRFTSSRVIYYYFKYQDPVRSSAIGMTRSLLRQALKYDKDLLPHFYEKTIDSEDEYLSSYRKAKELLQVALDNSTTPYYIVLDGLDECEEIERRTILSWIQSLNISEPAADSNQPVPEKVHIFVGSTEETDIKKKLSAFAKKRLRKESVRHGLQLYLEKRKDKIRDKFGLSDPELTTIMNDILLRAQGMSRAYSLTSTSKDLIS